MSKYPEHDKLTAPYFNDIPKKADVSQVVGEFLTWLPTQDIELARWVSVPDDDCDPDDHDDDCPTTSQLHLHQGNIEELLSKFFGIDRKKLSEEKDAMYQELREAANVGN